MAHSQPNSGYSDRTKKSKPDSAKSALSAKMPASAQPPDRTPANCARSEAMDAAMVETTASSMHSAHK